MAIRYARPGKTPFFITPRDDGFKMALIKDGRFVGWREKGTRFASKDEAWKAFEEAFGHRPDLTVAEIL